MQRTKRGVPPVTAHRWITRWNAVGDDQRRVLDCLKDRSSRPYRQTKRTDAALAQLILDLRARTNLGPARLSHIVHLAPSTILKVLKRHGKSVGHAPHGPSPGAMSVQCQMP